MNCCRSSGPVTIGERSWPKRWDGGIDRIAENMIALSTVVPPSRPAKPSWGDDKITTSMCRAPQGLLRHGRNSMDSVKRAAAVIAGLGLGLIQGQALAQEKTLAIVVKGLDNPFFEQINLGCQKWNKENASSGYKCFYTGPASSADEAGEVQIVDDLLTKGVAAIAISPSNAPAMATLLKRRAPTIPVMTIDADLGK